MKINNIAYELDFPPSYNMSHTFNVGELFPFSVRFMNLWSNFLQKGKDDESITYHEAIEDLPRRVTRSMTRREASNPTSLSLFFISLC